MRCKNCGWNNPDGNVRCEKCNAQLKDASGFDGAPQCTVVSEEFNPRLTAIPCVACGYPIRPGDTECPECSQPVYGVKKAPVFEKQPEKQPEKEPEKEPEKQPVKEPVVKGTVIQELSKEKDKDKEAPKTDRRKLIGFLVTYSISPNGDFFPLYEGRNFIGRATSGDVCLQGDTMISDKHLSILYRPVDKKFKFKDEQSSNGTFINGELLDEGELKNFDKILVGATQLLFIAIPLSSFE